MKKHDLEFKRELTLEKDGKTSKVAFSIGSLEQSRPDGPWRCSCFIPSVMRRAMIARGEDELDALINALSFGRYIVRDYEVHSNARLWWLEPGDLGGIKDYVVLPVEDDQKE